MPTITVTKGLIGREDINFASGGGTEGSTFSRATSVGGSQSLHKISAVSIPLEDLDSRWTVTNLEALLEGWAEGTETLLDSDTYLLSVDNAGVGTVNLIRANTDDDAEIGADLVPDADDTHDLGTSAQQWKDLYIDGTAYIDVFSVGSGGIAICDATGNLDGTVVADADLGDISVSSGSWTINAEAVAEAELGSFVRHIANEWWPDGTGPETNSATYTELCRFSFYRAANHDTLVFRVRITDTGNYLSYIQVVVGGSSGQSSPGIDLTTDYATGSVDISGESTGWLTIVVNGKKSSGGSAGTCQLDHIGIAVY